MTALPLRACADCGLVIAIGLMSFKFDRPLCPLCYRDEVQSKRDAEIWLLEEMLMRSTMARARRLAN